MTTEPTTPMMPAKGSSPEANTGAGLWPANYDDFHRSEVRPSTPQRPIAMTQSDYERFRDLVLERVGLDFHDDKRSMLSAGLTQGMAATGCQNLDQFYALLRNSSHTSAVWDGLVSALTVGETYFFRHAPHFDALANTILPGIIAQREHASRRIRIWSAGCATGEEPYSVAILLRELIPNLESWNVLILATDINRDALRRAQEGLYGAWSFRGVEKRIQDIYFHPNGNKQFVLTEKIKRMVTFDYLNLVEDHYPSLTNNTNAMDVILCRNVTIYFKSEMTQTVLRNFYHCLIEGGWLIPGPAEPNLVFYRDYESRSFPGTVVYQKPALPKAAKPTPPATFPSPTQALAFTPPLVEARKPAPPPQVVQAQAKPAPRPDVYAAALALIHSGQVDEALAKLYEKIDQDPHFAPAYSTLGKVYANRGNLEEAQHWCERAIQIDKLHPEPYYTLSLVYQQNGLLDMAKDALKKALYLDRGFVLAHYNLAHIYASQGDRRSARKSLQNAQQLLAGKPPAEVLPEGDGLVAGRLLELVENELAQEG